MKPSCSTKGAANEKGIPLPAAASARSRGMSSVTCRPLESRQGIATTSDAPRCTQAKNPAWMLGSAISICATSTIMGELSARSSRRCPSSTSCRWASARRLPWSMRRIALVMHAVYSRSSKSPPKIKKTTAPFCRRKFSLSKSPPTERLMRTLERLTSDTIEIMAPSCASARK